MLSLEPLINRLLETPYAKPYKEEYVYVRCPLCGDSTKHLDHPHCSIWIKAGQPLIYHCWICEESGIVTPQFLEELEISDLELFNQVNQYNKASSRRKDGTTFQYSSKERNYSIPVINENELNMKKLEYMRNRLGINFTLRSMEQLRIVFKLTDYLGLNKVAWNPDYKKQMYYLNRDYIGFVTTTRDMVILRSIEKDPKFRYIKYPLFENMILAEQMYMIPTGADIFAKSVDIHICEGTFDILGVFFNVKHCDCNNQLYAAVGGSGYIRGFKSILSKGFNTNLNVWIYSDKDKNIEFYNRFIREFRPWVNEIHILYNGMDGEKDFGVPKDRIIVNEAVWR